MEAWGSRGGIGRADDARREHRATAGAATAAVGASSGEGIRARAPNLGAGGPASGQHQPSLSVQQSQSDEKQGDGLSIPADRQDAFKEFRKTYAVSIFACVSE